MNVPKVAPRGYTNVGVRAQRVGNGWDVTHHVRSLDEMTDVQACAHAWQHLTGWLMRAGCDVRSAVERLETGDAGQIWEQR